MTTSPIAPVLFHVFPEDAPHSTKTPRLECFNAGVSQDDIASLTTPHKPAGRARKAAFIVAGIAGIGYVICGSAAIVALLLRRMDLLESPVLVNLEVATLGLTILSGVWLYFLMSPSRPDPKAWRAALGEAWSAHGSQVIVLKHLPNAVRSQVTEDLAVLEDIRKGLNRLDPSGGELAPAGDELDTARYAMLRYIEASDIPALSKRAAAATHIKDPAVRQAAKDYKQAIEHQRLTRAALDTEIESQGTAGRPPAGQVRRRTHPPHQRPLTPRTIGKP
jgi:hypothetical protein